jgi:hypothetical protein
MREEAWTAAAQENLSHPVETRYMAPHTEGPANYIRFEDITAQGYDLEQVVARVVIDSDDGAIVTGSFEFDGYGGSHDFGLDWMDIETCQGSGQFVIDANDIP